MYAQMKFREALGLMLMMAGIALGPLGWIISPMLLIASAVLVLVGGALFLTNRMVDRQIEAGRDTPARNTVREPVPSDIFNYSGWRSGGRTTPLDSTNSDGSDGD